MHDKLKGKTLREAERLARGQLATIADITQIGELVAVEQVDAHTFNLSFVCLKEAYPDWQWVVSLMRADEKAPFTVSELELLPVAGALLAPAWVPWSQRLAEYREARAAQALEEALAAAAAAEEFDEAEAEAEDELLDNDFSDFDDEINGVDVDALADLDFSQLSAVSELDADEDDDTAGADADEDDDTAAADADADDDAADTDADIDVNAER